MLFIITFIYVIHNEKSNLISLEVRRKIKDLKHREGRKLHNHEIHLQIRELKIKLGNWCFVYQLLILVSWRILAHVLCPKKNHCTEANEKRVPLVDSFIILLELL